MLNKQKSNTYIVLSFYCEKYTKGENKNGKRRKYVGNRQNDYLRDRDRGFDQELFV